MSWFENLFGGNVKDPERLYKRAMKLQEQYLYQDAVVILEELTKLKPNSALIYYRLATSFVHISKKYIKDDEKFRPIAKKSNDSFQLALDLNKRIKELNTDQVSIANNYIINYSFTSVIHKPKKIPENQQKKIYDDFKWIQQIECANQNNWTQEYKAIIQNRGLQAGIENLHLNMTNAANSAYLKIGANYKYTFDLSQLKAIIEEGEKNKWPFRIVPK